MDDHDAQLLNADLIAILRESAPWAAEQIDESVRQGKPTAAKQVRRRRGRETVETVALAPELRSDQFVETTELTSAERLSITLDAIERLLVDPASILGDVRRGLKTAGVSTVEFSEPDEDVRHELGGQASAISSENRERISELVTRIRSDVINVR